MSAQSRLAALITAIGADIKTLNTTKLARPSNTKLMVRVAQASGAYPTTTHIDRSVWYVNFVGPLDPWTSGDGQNGDEHTYVAVEVP